MQISGKKFVLIGGAGLIGSHTVDYLLRHDVRQVVVFDNFSRGSKRNIECALQDPRVSIYENGGDILHCDVLREALSGADGVFHFAAMWLLHCQKFQRSAFDVNIGGVFNVLEACVEQGVKRLVFSSSASVYGESRGRRLKEKGALDGENFYGATKIAGEALLRAFHSHYELEFAALRYMNVYGPRQDYRGAYVAVIMKMLDAIDRGEDITVNGDGSATYDFVSVYDCASANLVAMQSTKTQGYYNVGTGKGTTLKAIAEILIELTDSNVGIRYLAGETKAMVQHRVGEPSKAWSELGFKSSISLRDGLKQLIEWRKSDLAHAFASLTESDPKVESD